MRLLRRPGRPIFLQGGEEYLYQLGVELDPGIFLQFRFRRLLTFGVPPGPGVEHGVVSVSHGQDAGVQGMVSPEIPSR